MCIVCNIKKDANDCYFDVFLKCSRELSLKLCTNGTALNATDGKKITKIER